MKKISFAIPFLFCVLFLNAQKGSNLISSDTIYFDFAKDELNTQSKSQLETILNHLNKGDEHRYLIQAYTDNIGSNDYNIKLSNSRAVSVENYLKTSGLEFTDGKMEGFGEDQPFADNSSAAGRKLNRCAIVQLYSDAQEEEVTITEEFTEKGIEEEELPPPPQKIISGVLKDPETGEPVAGEIIVRTDLGIDTIQTDSDGKYELKRPVNSAITMDVFVPGYFYQSLKVNEEEAVEDIKLDKADVGKSATISNLYFYNNQAVLMPDSEPELDKLLKFMLDNQNINIELGGHVSGWGDYKSEVDSWMYRLSVMRGKMVYDYLIENGIPEKRMAYKGYADWQLIISNPKDLEEERVNRRVEIKVIEKEE